MTRKSLLFEEEAPVAASSRDQMYLEIKQKALVLGLTRLHKIHYQRMAGNFEKIKSFESLQDFLLHAIYFFSELTNKTMIKPRMMDAFSKIRKAGAIKVSTKSLAISAGVGLEGFDEKSRHVSYKLGLGYLLLCLNNLKRNFKALALSRIQERVLLEENLR